MIGNGVQLGAAVSLAHSLGLNRSPLHWDIPDAEKLLRMKLWWSLLIHDKWSSLAYGTPPHITRSQCDVPEPTLNLLAGDKLVNDAESKAASVFVALSGLTRVLDSYLQLLYHVDDQHQSGSHNVPTSELEYKLNEWVETLEDVNVRRIITRGTNLNTPGAANLRLCYLSIQLLLRRLELEEQRLTVPTTDTLSNRYIRVDGNVFNANGTLGAQTADALSSKFKLLPHCLEQDPFLIGSLSSKSVDIVQHASLSGEAV